MIWKAPQVPAQGKSPLTPDEQEVLWADLASASPTKARTAVARLLIDPAAAITFLATKFMPTVPAPDPAILRLVKDLDNDNFDTRYDAMKELLARGAKAESALRQSLAGNPASETRSRMERLLETISSVPESLQLPVSGETLRGIRALEVLERLGNPKARTLLQKWAEQQSNEHLASEAKCALVRLDATAVFPPGKGG